MIAGEAADTPMGSYFRAIDFAVSPPIRRSAELQSPRVPPCCSSMPAAPLSGIKGFEKTASITIDFGRQRHYV